MEFIDSLFNHPWYWLIGGAILMGLELMASGVFLLWIGLGATVTGLSVLLFPALPLAIQIIVLIVAMVGSVLIGVRLQSKRRQGQDPALALNVGLEQFIGRSVVAVNDFKNGQGRIRVEDTSYSACASEPVSAGDWLVVTDVQSNVFYVKPKA